MGRQHFSDDPTEDTPLLSSALAPPVDNGNNNPSSSTSATGPTMRSSFDDDTKADIAHRARVDPNDLDADRHLAVDMPESLRGMSKEQLHQMDKRTTWKVDLVLLPILIALYILNYLDRNNVSTAKIGGMTEDLHMTAKEFSTAVAILFASYISFQIPSNIVAARISKPGIYVCFMCVLWGCISACTAAVKGYTGMIVCRLFLGVMEAAFFPGALFLLQLFYTREQIAFRTGILYSGSQIGNAFGGLFALACLQLDGAHGIAGWRWLFIVEGVMTVGLGMVFALFIPNRPSSFRWLTQDEKDRLNYRLECDRFTKDATDEMGTWEALKLAVTDPKVLFLTLALVVNYIASAVTNFFPLVVQGLGFNRTVTLALTAPPYVLCVITIWIYGWHSDKTQERSFHIMAAFCVTIVAMALALATTKTAPRYVAMMLMPASFYSSSIVILSWMSSIIVGPSVKRAIAIAFINSVSNTSNIWTSYLYINPPRYTLAFAVNLAASVALIIIVFALRLYLQRLNRKLDRGESLGRSGPTQVQIDAGFRFQL